MGAELLQIGEMSLFLMGVVFSILLLCLLAIPFSIRFQVPCWMSHPSLSFDELCQKAIPYFRKKGYQVHRQDTGLSLRSNSSIYQLSYQPPSSTQDAVIHITQQGLDLSSNPHLSVLSGTGIAHIALDLDTLFNSSNSAHCRWGFNPQFTPSLTTPFSSFKRSAIQLSPWH